MAGSSTHLTMSIILATYNGERYLPVLLESLSKQTRLPDELVVCDDGSSDDTLAVVRAFAATAPFPVHVHVNPMNLGFNRNFLSGAARCTGELIAFCDQDDVWQPEKLAQCARVFRDGGVVLAVHAAEVVNQDLQPLGYAIQDFGRSRVVRSLATDPFFGPRGFSMVCRASLLQRLPFEQRPRNLEGKPQDFDEWIGFLGSVFGKTAYLQARLVRYRQHGQSVTAVAQSTGLLPSARRSAGAGAKSYAYRVQLLREYADFLEERAAGATGEQQTRLARAAAHYGDLSRRWARRTALYRSRPLPLLGLPRVLTLLLGGDYSPAMGGGLGLTSLVKDTFVATTGYRPAG
jgi:glycosyltransferase involved in cell wall biosynthesis